MKRWIHASSTSDKISYLQERIDVLEEKLRDDNYIDPEERIDDRIELEELKEQLNFAWQDDEAEYNYALQQQEFNPNGSLKGYHDIYDSTEIDASNRVTASTTTLSDSKSDCQWMLGLYWDVDGHDLTITGVNGYPLFSCEVTESWIAEDSGEERESKSWYDIKEDSRGYIYIQNKKHRDYKLYLQSAFNYTEDKVPSEFDELYFIRDSYDRDDEDIDDEYTPSATRGDYSPSNPWDAPGMSIRDFI